MQPLSAQLLRRLRLPLPWSVRRCRYGRPLDVLGQHGAGFAQQQGCWDAEVGRWSQLQPECAEKVEKGSAQTFLCATWIWHSTTTWMKDGWKWWRTGSLSSEDPSQPLTPQLCHLCTTDGSARRGAATKDGEALAQARRRKERTYPELAGEGGRARLVVLAAEVGGRWSDETADFLCQLAWAKVRELPEDLQRDGRRAWLRRWQKLLGCAAAKSFALSLLDLSPSGCDGEVPSVHEVICEARHS